jgi:hypothetical protein
MYDFNGAATQPLDPADLPYAQHGAAGPNWLIPLSIAFLVVCEVLNLTHLTSIPFYVAIAPAALLALHLVSFIRTRNAVLMALSAHIHNVKLDAAVEASQQAAQKGHLSRERIAAMSGGSAR